MKAEVYVVSHKKTKMPKAEIYLPLQVGKDPEILRDFCAIILGIIFQLKMKIIVN